MAEVDIDKLSDEDRKVLLQARRNAGYAKLFLKSRFWIETMRPQYEERLRLLRNALEDADTAPVEIIRQLQAQIKEVKALLDYPLAVVTEAPKIEEEILANTESQTPAVPPW